MATLGHRADELHTKLGVVAHHLEWLTKMKDREEVMAALGEPTQQILRDMQEVLAKQTDHTAGTDAG